MIFFCVFCLVEPESGVHFYRSVLENPDNSEKQGVVVIIAYNNVVLSSEQIISSSNLLFSCSRIMEVTKLVKSNFYANSREKK